MAPCTTISLVGQVPINALTGHVQLSELSGLNRPWRVQPWTTRQQGVIFSLMYEFTRLEKEPEPQASGNRFGPPRKHTAASLLDPAEFPPIHPRCFGCSRPLMIAEISRHILSCDRVLAEDLARFNAALVEFKANPSRAREVVAEFVFRVRLKYGLDAGNQSL